MSMAPCRCGQCQLCRVQDGWAQESAANAALRAQVEELRGILAAVDDHWYQGGSKTKDLHAVVQAARVGATSTIDRATRAEARVEKLIAAIHGFLSYNNHGKGCECELHTALAECKEGK